jgi:hypothetical protein
VAALVGALAVCALAAWTRVARASDECECLNIRDVRFYCAPEAYEDVFPVETARRVVRAAVEHARTHGWEKTRHRYRGVQETRQVRVSALGEATQREVASIVDKHIAPRMREQCMIQDHLRYEDVEFYVVKYESGDLSSVGEHLDHKHMAFLVSLNNVTDYTGGGNNFEGLALSVKDKGMQRLKDHVFPPLPMGGVIIHGGQLTHFTLDVLLGTRYVLVGEAHVNKSCCFDYTGFMNRWVTRALIFVFLLICVMTGLIDSIHRKIKLARNGGHEKVW